MPAKFMVKQFKPDMYAHIFNRGANKAEIFLSDLDYQFFRQKCRDLLEQQGRTLEVLTFCLLPNHFHLLLFQREMYAISTFMHSLATSYTMYFNQKYEHSGQLCQGKYKLVPLYSFEKIRETQEYILNNPQRAGYEIWEHVGWVL